MLGQISLLDSESWKYENAVSVVSRDVSLSRIENQLTLIVAVSARPELCHSP